MDAHAQTGRSCCHHREVQSDHEVFPESSRDLETLRQAAGQKKGSESESVHEEGGTDQKGG